MASIGIRSYKALGWMLTYPEGPWVAALPELVAAIAEEGLLERGHLAALRGFADQLRSLEAIPGLNPIDEHLDLLNLVRRSPADVMRREIEEHSRAHFPPVTRRPQPRYHMRSTEEDDDFGS